MTAFYIAIYLNEYKGGQVGPTIWANTLDEAQRKAESMFGNIPVVACYA